MYKNKHYIFLLLLLLAIIFFLIAKSTEKPDGSPTSSTSAKLPIVTSDYDLATKVVSEELHLQAISAAKSGDYEKSLGLFLQLKEKYRGTPEEGVIDNSIADTLFTLGRRSESGLLYAEIYNNTSYTNVTRGYAILRIWLKARGSQDFTVLEPFFTKDEYQKLLSAGALENRMAERVYELYPFSYAGAFIARERIIQLENQYLGNQNSTKGSDGKHPQDLINAVDEVMAKFLDVHERDVKFLSQQTRMKHLLGSTRQAVARLYAELDLKGYTLEGLSTETLQQRTHDKFLQAIAASRLINSASSEQFSMILLANYLANKNKFPQSEEVIVALSRLPVDSFVKENLSRDDAKMRYPGLDRLVKSNSNITYFRQFGW